MPFPTFENLEAVPDDQKDVYEVREDGKAYPKIPDVTGAVSTAAAEREKAKTEEKARKKAEADLVELRRTIAARESGITDEQLQKIRDDEAKARKPIEDERDTLKSEVRKLTLTDRVQKMGLDAGWMPDRIEDTMVLLGLKPAAPRVDLTDTGGIVVKDRDGNITAETIEAFLSKTFKAEKGWVYAGSGSSGSGAGGSSGSGGGSGGKELSMAELIERKRAMR